MDYILETITISLMGILFLLYYVTYFRLTKNYNYWNHKRVPNIKPEFPFGSTKDLVLAITYIGKGYDNMYKKFPNEKFFGIIDLNIPVLVLRDPDIIKSVMVKDFNNFEMRTNIETTKDEYILKHVINMNGKEWKDMRTLLTPAFTSVKMKLVFDLMEKCSEQLKDYLLVATEKHSEVEVTDLLARFTMDVIATCAFGVETNSISNPNCDFFVTVGAMLKTTKGRFIRRVLNKFFPALTKFFTIKLIPPKVTHMLTQAVRESVSYREENKMQRNDFLDVLLKARLKKDDLGDETPHEGLTVEQMTAQAFVFFIAGYTTDTSVMSFCLYELSRHPTIQDRLHEDIQQTIDKHRGQLSYQALQEMTYLDQVINETLRLYGSGQTLQRICTKPYNIPDTDIVLERGTRILIPTYSLHHDPKYYPDPYEYKPERFTPEKIKERHTCVFLPFGEGPRNCIGRSFGLQQMKIGLATLLSSFKVELSPRQTVPIEIDKRCIVVTPANPVLLKFIKRNLTHCNG